LTFQYNCNLLSSIFPHTSRAVSNDAVTRIHSVDSVKSTPAPFVPLYLNYMVPQLNMITALKGSPDYVVFNVIMDSGCSSHTFNCLNYIDNYKVMIEEDHSSMVLADRSRVRIRGKDTCGVLGDVY